VDSVDIDYDTFRRTTLGKGKTPPQIAGSMRPVGISFSLTVTR
jgi:hypothetical protein